MKAACALVLTATTLLWPATASAQNYRTQSGRVLCAVTQNHDDGQSGPHVVCQGGFSQAPENDNLVVTVGDGAFSWAQGNIAIDDPTTNMTYGQSYQRDNWTIFHDVNGTRFTNDLTGHGLFVSVENVYAF